MEKKNDNVVQFPAKENEIPTAFVTSMNVKPPLIEDDDIDKVVEYAAKMADKNEDIESVRADKCDPEDGKLVEKTKTFAIGPDGKPIYAKEDDGNGLKEMDIDILDLLKDGAVDTQNDAEFKEAFTSNATESYGLSDQEATDVLEAIVAYKNGEQNIYNILPGKVKGLVDAICMENQMPASMKNKVAKDLIKQFINEASIDKSFVDFEKALEKAMQIPSLVDLYNEHINTTMGEKLPLMAKRLRENGEDDKADMILKIFDRYNWAASFSEMRRMYDETARIRKAVRRDYDKYHRFCEELNYANQDTEFKISDATSLYSILVKAIVNEDEDPDITEVDVMKFITLLCKSVDNLNMKEVLDAAYVYYLLKNIVMLSYTNDNAKSTFSVELINNIKVLIYYIRAKESEFDEARNPSEQHKQKRSKRIFSRK